MAKIKDSIAKKGRWDKMMWKKKEMREKKNGKKRMAHHKQIATLF